MRGKTLSQAIRELMTAQPEEVRRLAAHTEVLTVAAGHRLGLGQKELALLRWEANLCVAEDRDPKVDLVRAAKRLAELAAKAPDQDPRASIARLKKEGCDHAVLRALAAVAPLVQPVSRP